MSGENDNGLALELGLRVSPGSTLPSAIPRRELLFEPVRDRYGLRLALVFGNHAPGGICPYYTGELCYHCDIGAGEGAAFDHATNRQRLAWFANHYQQHLASVRHLVLYNSGSILNPREMPPDLLDEILIFVHSLAASRVISLDSREAYIRPESLRRILSIVGAGIMVRPNLGIESADERIRNEVLQKGMLRTTITRVFSDLGTIASESGKHRVGLDVNIVIAGPGTTNETAVDDAAMTARFALNTGLVHGVSVDLNLHPYYVGSRGSDRFPDHRRCSIATTARAVAKIVEVVRSMGSDSSIFIGWQDEAHDLEQQRRSLEMRRVHSEFDLFNQTNDPGVLLEGRLS